MKKVFVLLTFISLMASCSENVPKKERPFDFGQLYRVYFHVSRDIENEKEIYHYDHTPLNRSQTDTLINILNKRNIDYKTCSDNTFLVSTIGVPDAYSMSTIDDELKERLGKKGYKW